MSIPAAAAVITPNVAQPKYLSNGEFTHSPITLSRLVSHRARPPCSFRHRVRARTHEDRDAQHSGADQTQREEQVGPFAGKRTQSLGGLPGRRDVGLPMRM